jgi:hypothetical protein
MLMFFTMMIYVPILYNYVSILLFVLLFPFYYAFITELIKVLPGTGKSSSSIINLLDANINKNKQIINSKDQNTFEIIKLKIREYFI